MYEAEDDISVSYFFSSIRVMAPRAIITKIYMPNILRKNVSNLLVLLLGLVLACLILVSRPV